MDSETAGRERDHSLVLDAARAQADSGTAVIYGLRAETFEV